MTKALFGWGRSRPGLETTFEPPVETWPDAWVYQIWPRVTSDSCVKVGKLGRFLSRAGAYVYTGRASRELKARVLRHVQGAKCKHWQIDCPPAHRYVCVERLVMASSDPELECIVNQVVGNTGLRVAPGFGALDGRTGCAAHLWQS